MAKKNSKKRTKKKSKKRSKGSIKKPVLESIEVVEDNTATSTLDEGFLRMRRLRIRNIYTDGSSSEAYPCDVVSRRFTDAVAIVVWERIDSSGTNGTKNRSGTKSLRVAMRTGIRPPVYFRKDRTDILHPDDREYLLLTEICAGVLEDDDVGEKGILHRAAEECHEEAGYKVPKKALRKLGNAMFASPGVSDEKVFFCSAETNLDKRGEAHGDGSPMEDGGEVVLYDIDEAIHMCRSGAIPDGKTEIGLMRLCHAVGYIPQLGCFVDDFPESMRPNADRAAWLLGDSSTM